MVCIIIVLRSFLSLDILPLISCWKRCLNVKRKVKELEKDPLNCGEDPDYIYAAQPMSRDPFQASTPTPRQIPTISASFRRAVQRLGGTSKLGARREAQPILNSGNDQSSGIGAKILGNKLADLPTLSGYVDFGGDTDDTGKLPRCLTYLPKHRKAMEPRELLQQHQHI
jgi:hypothetical protein